MTSVSRAAVFGVSLGCLILAAAVPGHLEIQKEKPERHETIVRLVLVDVVAMDKADKVVLGLTAENFEIFEDGERMDIHSPDFISFEDERAQVSVLPAAA